MLVIGDVHGHRPVLELLLDELKISESDQVIFLGDYVDKGSDVAGALELKNANHR